MFQGIAASTVGVSFATTTAVTNAYWSSPACCQPIGSSVAERLSYLIHTYVTLHVMLYHAVLWFDILWELRWLAGRLTTKVQNVTTAHVMSCDAVAYDNSEACPLLIAGFLTPVIYCSLCCRQNIVFTYTHRLYHLYLRGTCATGWFEEGQDGFAVSATAVPVFPGSV